MPNAETMTKPEAHRTRVDDGSFWNDRKILVVREEADGKRVYDLEERTDTIIVITDHRFCKNNSARAGD